MSELLLTDQAELLVLGAADAPQIIGQALAPPPAEVLLLTEAEVLLVDAAEAEQLLVDAPGPVQLLQVAEQGPPGPPGGASTTYPAATTVQGHKAVLLTADGGVALADCAVAQHLGAVAGISLNAALVPDSVRVQAAGEIDHPGWAWAPDAPVFLGSAGALVQPQPVGAAFVQVLGWARSATRLLVALQPPVFLGGV